MNERTILIVDDDEAIRDALCDILREEGYTIAEASDGGSALAYLERHAPPALILLDWNMAPMNATAFMVERTRRSFGTPVVLLTADIRVNQKVEMHDFAGHLSKPVDIDDLLKMIRTIL